MNRWFKKYLICWAILLAAFNIICFATPTEFAGYRKFGGAFWSGYVFIMLAFIGQIICAYFALREKNIKQLFLNLPLITVSYSGLVLSFILGAVCMAVPDLPNWVGIILCAAVLCFTAIAVIRASAAAELAAETEQKVQTKTSFVRTITVDAENLIGRAKTDDAKADCKKVYEALRYSDPMSSESLAGIESEISRSFEAFSAKIKAGEACSDLADELVNLIGDRNRKCKVMK